MKNKKGISDYGLRWGLIFAIIGIPINLICNFALFSSLIGIAELVTSRPEELVQNISLFILLAGFVQYFFAPRLRIEKNTALILLFVVCAALLDIFLFLLNYKNSTDGQVGLVLLLYPFMKAILYPILGLIHDLLYGNPST